MLGYDVERGAVAQRPTLADVADRAGLSKTAVSLVLNNRPNSRLSPEAVQRVRDAASELNYRPNPAARSLRIGKTRTVGFISDDVTATRSASAMIRGLLDVAEDRDHTVVIAETGSSSKRMQEALRVMLDRQADGVILGLMAAREVVVPAMSEDVPVVMLNATSTQGHTSVLPDERSAGYEVARVLLEGGHRKIAVVGDWPYDTFEAQETATLSERFAGIHAAFAEHDLEPVSRVPLRVWEPEGGYASTRQVLASGAAPTALICLNDRVAFGAYQAIQEAGLQVPSDISVISFDDDAFASYLRPGLTTAQLPYAQMGRCAMGLLLDGTIDERRHLLGMPLQHRGSTSVLQHSSSDDATLSG